MTDIPQDLRRFYNEACSLSGIDPKKWKLVLNHNEKGNMTCLFTEKRITMGQCEIESGRYRNRLNRWAILHEVGHARQVDRGVMKYCERENVMKWNCVEQKEWGHSGWNSHIYASFPWEVDASTFAFTHPLYEPIRQEDYDEMAAFLEHAVRAHHRVRLDLGVPMKLEGRRSAPKEPIDAWRRRVLEMYSGLDLDEEQAEEQRKLSRMKEAA